MRKTHIFALPWVAVLGVLLGTASHAQQVGVPYFPQSLPPNSVVGNNLGIYAPANAIPFSTLAAQVYSFIIKAFSDTTIASPTAPNSTSVYKMQGLGAAIAPVVSNRFLVTISGTIIATTQGLGNGIQYQISYGTGTAPSNNATLTGTQVGTIQAYEQQIAGFTAADVKIPFSITAVFAVSGPKTSFWIDLAAESIGTASSYGLQNVTVAVMEF